MQRSNPSTNRALKTLAQILAIGGAGVAVGGFYLIALAANVWGDELRMVSADLARVLIAIVSGGFCTMMAGLLLAVTVRS